MCTDPVVGKRGVLADIKEKQEAAELNERQPGRPRKDKHASAKYVVATSV